MHTGGAGGVGGWPETTALVWPLEEGHLLWKGGRGYLAKHRGKITSCQKRDQELCQGLRGTNLYLWCAPRSLQEER